MAEPAASAPAPPPDTPAPRKVGFLQRLNEKLDSTLRIFFYRFGYFVAGNPWKTIAVMVAITLVALVGMLRFRTEARPQELWVPQGTQALDNKDYVDPRFGNFQRFSQIVFVPSEDDGDMGNKQSLLDMVTVLRVAEGVEGEPVDPPNGDGTPTTYQERCVKATDINGIPYCLTTSALDLFYNPDNVQNDADGNPNFLNSVEDEIKSLSDADVRKVLLNEDNEERKSWTQSTFIDDSFIAITDDKVTALLYFQIANNNLTVSNGDDVDFESNSYETALVEAIIDEKEDIKADSVDWFLDTVESQGASLETALTGDLPLFSIGVVLLVIYVVLFLGEFHTVRSRFNLGVFAILNSGLALGFAFGVSSALGMFYGPVHNLIALLLIGIGVDDIMVITKALNEIDRTNERFRDKDVRNKIGLALSQAGTAITVTSFTNFLVFLVSAISSLPALKFFALWAAIGVIADYVWSCTFYVACLTLDQRRIEANKRDCCPCFKPVEQPKDKNWFGRPFGGFHRFFGEQLGPLIMRPVSRIAILAVVLGLLATSIYGATQLIRKFRFSFFYPSGTSQYDFQQAFDSNFEERIPQNVYVRDIDITTAENQKKYVELCKPETGIAAESEWVIPESVDCWLYTMRQVNGITNDDEAIPAGEFYDVLKEFLGTGAGGRYEDDLSFFENGTLEASRFTVTYKYAESNAQEIDRLLTLREDVETAGFGDNAFVYSFFDTFVEQYIALPREIGLSLGLACAAVFIVCFILIGHPIVALVSVIVVSIIIMDVVGFLYYSGYNINSVSTITLAISVGIAVDYVVHIARAFLEQVGTRSERAIKSLEELGPPVFHAGFSTFLAIIVLAGSVSYIFKTIFAGFLTLIVFGLFHGIILTPVLLSFFGPKGLYETQEEKTMAELALEERVAAAISKSKDGGDESENVIVDGSAA